MTQICWWLTCAVESQELDPRPQLEVTYDGLQIHIQPHTDEYCNTFAVFIEPPTTQDEVLLRINRFLSAMAWKDNKWFIMRGGIASGALPEHKNQPRFNYREKRHYPSGVISRFDFEHLFVASNDQQKLALALYRDGLGVDNAFYRFLSYYKIINILFSDPNQQMKWINDNIANVPPPFASERAKKLAAAHADVGKYLYVQGRTAIAHAFSNPTRDPDLPSDRNEIRADCDVIKTLAAILMENELGIPSLQTVWREHTYELAGFKDVFDEAVVAELCAGGSPLISEFPPVLWLTLNLKEHERYMCLERLRYRVVSSSKGVVTLETDNECVFVTLILNFPSETLEFDFEVFHIDNEHWEYDQKQVESYFQFSSDYLRNGCLQIFDGLSGDRLSHKLAFIPMNVDLHATLEDWNRKKLVALSSFA